MKLHRDLAFGLRMLRKNTLLLVVASLSLGLGIGLNVTVFSAVNAVLFRAPSIERAGDLVNFYSSKEGLQDLHPTSYPDLLDMRERMSSLDALVGHALAMVNYDRGGVPTVEFGAVVSSGYFELLETKLALGRLLQSDDFDSKAPVVVVSYKFWQDELGGSPAAVGSTVRLGSQVFEIVGVLPEGFTGLSRGLAPNIFVPITANADVQTIGEVMTDGSANGRSLLEWRGFRFLNVTGRLAVGASLAQAQGEASALATALAADYPDSNTARGTVIRASSGVRFDPELDGVLVSVALLLLGLVGMVLIVACGNVANFLLAKAQSRAGEMALRTALGASRPQIVSQLLVESALYGLVCGAVGLGIAALAIKAFGLMRLDLPFQPEIALRLDTPVLLFTFGLSLATTLLFGLIPARHAGRLALVPLLRSGGAATAGSRRWFHPANLMVIGQVAASLVLVVTAGLLFRSLGAARDVDVGFEVDRLGTVAVQLRDTDVPPEDRPALWDRIKARVAALPGIEAVSHSSRLPMGLNIISNSFFIPGVRDTENDPPLFLDTTNADEDYFRTLGLTLAAGRLIDERDRMDTPLVAVVTEATVQRFWPGETGLGKTFRVATSDGPQFEIVGVVRDYKIRTPGESPRPMVHLAWNQRVQQNGVLVFRATAAPERMLEQVIAAARAESSSALIVQSTTMARSRALLLLPLSAGSVAAAALGSLALFLAVLGLSGLIAYWVNRRAREIGLRMALGAGRGSVLRLVASRAVVLVGGGLVFGGVLALALGQLLQPALYVSGFDPVSLGVGVAVLIVAGVIASVIPARRAASIDPMTVLRQD
jgi:predicted permease